MTIAVPNSKVHGANMGPIWGRQDPGGPYVGPMNFAISGDLNVILAVYKKSICHKTHFHNFVAVFNWIKWLVSKQQMIHTSCFRR